MDLKSQGDTFFKVLENNKSKILWEFKQQLPDQPDTAVVVKEQKRVFVIEASFLLICVMMYKLVCFCHH